MGYIYLIENKENKKSILVKQKILRTDCANIYLLCVITTMQIENYKKIGIVQKKRILYSTYSKNVMMKRWTVKKYIG